MRLSAGVYQDQFCGRIERAIVSTQQNVVPAPLAEKFPRSLEQLEEFADDLLFRRICNDAYHCQEPSAQRGYRLFICPKPFFKKNEAK